MAVMRRYIDEVLDAVSFKIGTRLSTREIASIAGRLRAERIEMEDADLPDVWMESIKQWISANNRSSVTTNEVLKCVLGADKFNRADQMRVARCLRSMRWERKQVWFGGKLQWRYFQPELDAISKPDTATWSQQIRGWIRANNRSSVTTNEILQHAFGADKFNRADQMRVADCLKAMGWKRKQVWLGSKGGVQWRYVQPENDDE